MIIILEVLHKIAIVLFKIKSYLSLAAPRGGSLLQRQLRRSEPFAPAGYLSWDANEGAEKSCARFSARTAVPLQGQRPGSTSRLHKSNSDFHVDYNEKKIDFFLNINEYILEKTDLYAFLPDFGVEIEGNTETFRRSPKKALIILRLLDNS